MTLLPRQLEKAINFGVWSLMGTYQATNIVAIVTVCIVIKKHKINGIPPINVFSGHSSRGEYTVNYSAVKLLLKHLLLMIGYYTSALKWYRLLAFPSDSPSRPEATEYPDLQNWSSEDR